MIHWWNRVVLKRLPIEKAAGAGIPRHMAGAVQERLLTRMRGSTSPSVIVPRQGFN